MSLQSYLVVQFRDAADRASRRLLLVLAGIAATGIVLAALGWLIGPAVFGWLFPGEPVPDGWFVAALVISSALVAAMFVSGAAVLARSQHFIYSAGWVVGAVVTVGVLLLPLDLATRTILALIAGPAVGLAVQLGYLVSSRRP